MHIKLRDFGCCKKVDLDLPDKGVVLFLGDNGVGKSLIGEAITWCLWRRWIRSATRDWSAVNDTSLVELTIGNSYWGRTNSDFYTGSGDSVRDNNLLTIGRFGKFGNYVTTRVFHKSLLTKFSCASDSGRKAILEHLLGLSVFDDMLLEVKAELQSTLAQVSEVEATLRIALSERSFLQGRLSELSRPRPPRKTADFDEKLQQLEALKDVRDALPGNIDVFALSQTCNKAQQRLESLEAKARDYAKLLKREVCPTCGGAIDQEHFDALIDDLRSQITLARNAYVAACHKRDAATAKYNAWKARSGVYNQLSRYIELQKFIYEDAVTNYQANLSSYLRKKRNLEALLEYHNTQLREIYARKRLIEHRLARLRDLKKVYGPNGARALLLQDALTRMGLGISHLLQSLYGRDMTANVGFSDLGTRLQLTITLQDAIEIPYKGLSEGEKVLVDFALLKSLANLSPGSNELPIIYDDVMDAVSSTNRTALANFITQESHDNLILIFSHDYNIKDLFKKPKVYFVESGGFYHEASAYGASG